MMPLASCKVEQEVAFVPYHLVDKDGKARSWLRRGDDELEGLGFVSFKSREKLGDIVNIPLILLCILLDIWVFVSQLF